MRFHDGDMAMFERLRSMYPLFVPFGPIRQLATAIAENFALPEMTGVLIYTDPAVFAMQK